MAKKNEGVYVDERKHTLDEVDHDVSVAGWGTTKSGIKYMRTSYPRHRESSTSLPHNSHTLACTGIGPCGTRGVPIGAREAGSASRAASTLS